MEHLKEQGFSPAQPPMVRKRLCAQERGTCYVLELRPEMSCCLYQIDGNIIKNNQTDKCDFLALVSHDERWCEIFVELKGSNIAHAIKQIESTITSHLFKDTVRSLRKARIVTANRIPVNTGNSIIERAKVNFKKMGCDFKAIKSFQPDILRTDEF